MKIAIVGSTQNAYRFGALLQAEDVAIACAWDYEHRNADAFCRQFGGEVICDIERVADFGLDGVMICTKSTDLVRYALPFIEGGVPTFIDGPLTPDMDRVLDAVQEHGTPVMFAPNPIEETGAIFDKTDVVYDHARVMKDFLHMCDTGEPVTIPRR